MTDVEARQLRRRAERWLGGAVGTQHGRSTMNALTQQKTWKQAMGEHTHGQHREGIHVRATCLHCGESVGEGTPTAHLVFRRSCDSEWNCVNYTPTDRHGCNGALEDFLLALITPAHCEWVIL